MVVLLRCSSGYLTSSRRPLSWAYGADQIGVGSKVEIERVIRDPIRSTRAQVGDGPARRLAGWHGHGRGPALRRQVHHDQDALVGAGSHIADHGSGFAGGAPGCGAVSKGRM